MAESLDLINTALPALFKRLDFQVGKQLPILSTSGCRYTLRSLVIDSGMPRYLIGKGSSLPGKELTRETVSSRLHCIGERRHLLPFVFRPEARPNSSRMAWSRIKSCFAGLTTTLNVMDAACIALMIQSLLGGRFNFVHLLYKSRLNESCSIIRLLFIKIYSLGEEIKEAARS